MHVETAVCLFLFLKVFLLGCIGGMGVFISVAAIGTCIGKTIEFSAAFWLAHVFTAPALMKLALLLPAEVALVLSESNFDNTIITPLVLLLFPVAIVSGAALCGISIQDLQNAGWMLSLDDAGVSKVGGALLQSSEVDSAVAPLANSAVLIDFTSSLTSDSSWISLIYSNVSLLNIWADFDIHSVHFSAVFTQIPTILACVFMSILQPALNVPSLSLSTGVPSRLDNEMKVHGAASLASAALGGLQCYMGFSGSILIQKCGLRCRAAGAAIAICTVAFLILSPAAKTLHLMPAPSAALFMLHTGVIMLADAFCTARTVLAPAEYCLIAFMAFGMQFSFVGGMLFGAAAYVCRAAAVNYFSSNSG